MDKSSRTAPHSMMDPQNDVRRFFQKVVVEYNCGDIRTLLDHKMDIAGPLLACVVNGIDMVGAMKCGFGTSSRERSEAFIREYLDLAPNQAKVLYSLVRCGIAHEGVPKPGITFFVCEESVDPGMCLYRGRDGRIWLNVSELARLYLAAVEMIAQSPADHLSHVPLSDKATSRLLEHASLPKTIDDFCDVVATRIGRKVERGDIHTSASPFFPESLSGYTLQPGEFRANR
ncbi:MAG: hypothetical protein NTZ17_02135 [Phycisphaerae bacterium]|nr:hypothetical protein [Phycisphaerae bacterium]